MVKSLAWLTAAIALAAGIGPAAEAQFRADREISSAEQSAGGNSAFHNFITRSPLYEQRILRGEIESLDIWIAELTADVARIPDTSSTGTDAGSDQQDTWFILAMEYARVLELCSVTAIVSDKPLVACRTPISQFAELASTRAQRGDIASQGERERSDVWNIVRAAPAIAALIDADRTSEPPPITDDVTFLPLGNSRSHGPRPLPDSYRLAATILEARRIGGQAHRRLEPRVLDLDILGPPLDFSASDLDERILHGVLYVAYLDLTLREIKTQALDKVPIYTYYDLDEAGRRQALLVHYAAEVLVEENGAFADIPLMGAAVTEVFCGFADQPRTADPDTPTAPKVLDAYRDFPIFVDGCREGRNRQAIWEAGLAATAGSVEP